jgi:HD-GYP domain-containing protein (c-di-GMP phosphodiesterase class II)
MRQHVEIGFELVKGIPFLTDAAEIIIAHHERHDGSGYPRGLKAEEILVGARIFAVADSFDAITSDRPYRRASPFEVGRETLQREAGRLFDPQVVRMFLSIPAETLSTIASDQRQVSALPSRLRKDNPILRLDRRQ